MINGMAALVAYLNSFPAIVSAATSTENNSVVNIYGSQAGRPPDNLITNNSVIEPAVTIRRLSRRQTPGDPRETWRLQLRTFDADATKSFNLTKLIHNTAFVYVDGAGREWPVRNKVIDNKWFLFSVDATGEGPFTTLEEPIKTDVTITSYDLVFDSREYIP